VRNCLKSLQQQTIGSGAFDILVVDSCGTTETGDQLAAMVAEVSNARLLRADQPGVSTARNLGMRESAADFVAYIDDDALAAPDWLACMREVIAMHPPWPGVVGGRVLPVWERPLPDWWPPSLRGVLSIIEWEGRGEYRTAQVPAKLEPYGVNMAVQRLPLLEAGGFPEHLGRFAGLLLSDEDVQVAWQLQDRGYRAWYDSRIVVRHQIQGRRMNPAWLLDRLYWQGMSTVATRRSLGYARDVWRAFPRRLAVELVCLPTTLVPGNSPRLMAPRWRLAYARGFTRMALCGGARKRDLPARLLRRFLAGTGGPVIRTRSGEAPPALGTVPMQPEVPVLIGPRINNPGPVPRVSIGLPVYNGERYLARAVESILGQDFTDFELIICDNASTDGTAAICRALAERDARIRYHRNAKNLGAGPNYDRCFHLARGTYFKWAAHDDCLAPNYLSKAVAAMDAAPDAVLCTVGVAEIDADDRSQRIYRNHFPGISSPHSAQRLAAVIHTRHECEDFFGLFRRTALVCSGLHGTYSGSDRVLLAEMALRGPWVSVPEPLFLHREHTERYTRAVLLGDRSRAALWMDTKVPTARASRHYHLGVYRQYLHLVSKTVHSPGARAACYAELLRWWLTDGHFPDVLRDLLRDSPQVRAWIRAARDRLRHPFADPLREVATEMESQREEAVGTQSVVGARRRPDQHEPTPPAGLSLRPGHPGRN
jgi:glycosyltransferase involved in cell wall biosynthesis